QQHKLPSAQLTILSICRFAEPVALTGVFPYLPEMIESFDVPKAKVAQWAGIASAIFSISQCITAIPWGRASDKYGRKPIIILAMTCAMVSSMLFGFSRSLTWAIIARAASGASNGNVGILRTTVAEMVPQRSLQPKAFATLPLVWQVGSIVGPILGGALADPAQKLPHIFGKSKFLKTFPYALPNLVSGVVFTIGLIIGILFLKESLETKKDRKDYGRMVGAWLTRPCTKGRKGLRPADDFESALPNSKHHHHHHAPPRYRDVFSRQANLNLLAYFFLGMHGVTYNQLLPVFLHLPTKRDDVELPFKFGGGFGLESGRIGLIFTLFGVFSMLCQFTLFPYVSQRFGVLNCYRACTFLFPITYFITPFTVLMPTPLTQQGAVLGVLLFKALADVFAFPCNTILLTNSANSVRILGTLNGVGTSLSAIGRAIGPYVVGRTFTWGVDIGYVVIAWWLLAGIAIIGHLVTWWLAEGEGFGVDDTV
ncbi:MFS general substrate transporter, partial [Rhizodiscina lignyota]